MPDTDYGAVTSRVNGGMDMQKYLAEVRHAVETVLPAVWAERNAIDALLPEVKRLTALTQHDYLQAESIAMNAEDPDDVMLAVGRRFETYFGVDKERHAAQTRLDEVEARLAARRFSLDALAGSLLQYGKQAISVVHRQLAACPTGRAVGDQCLRDVVWQGRNQALHWEESQLRQPVIDCFNGLAKSADAKFADYAKRSLAYDVVDFLGWRSFGDFERDLLSIG